MLSKWNYKEDLNSCVIFAPSSIKTEYWLYFDAFSGGASNFPGSHEWRVGCNKVSNLTRLNSVHPEQVAIHPVQ